MRFNQLFTITNMPIARFGSMLVTKGQFVDYMNLLRANHSDANLSSVMCKSLLSVDWQGYLYDCDFNQQLGLVIPGQIASSRRHLRDLLDDPLIGAPFGLLTTALAARPGQAQAARVPSAMTQSRWRGSPGGSGMNLMVKLLLVALLAAGLTAALHWDLAHWLSVEQVKAHLDTLRQWQGQNPWRFAAGFLASMCW